MEGCFQENCSFSLTWENNANVFLDTIDNREELKACVNGVYIRSDFFCSLREPVGVEGSGVNFHRIFLIVL